MILMLSLLLAGSTGLEPAASGVTGRRSNQLNYDPEQTAPDVQQRPPQSAQTRTTNLSDRRAFANPHSARGMVDRQLPASATWIRGRWWWAVQDSNL